MEYGGKESRLLSGLSTAPWKKKEKKERKKHLRVLPGVRVDTRDPGSDVVKALLFGNIVNEEEAQGAAVIRSRDAAKSLLSRRIPDLRVRARKINWCVGLEADNVL